MVHSLSLSPSCPHMILMPLVVIITGGVDSSSSSPVDKTNSVEGQITIDAPLSAALAVRILFTRSSQTEIQGGAIGGFFALNLSQDPSQSSELDSQVDLATKIPPQWSSLGSTPSASSLSIPKLLSFRMSVEAESTKTTPVIAVCLLSWKDESVMVMTPSIVETTLSSASLRRKTVSCN